MMRRNTAAFSFMAWTSFASAFLAMFIGIYTLEEPLSEKGYYAVAALYLTISAFVLQKTIRDNQEDDELYGPRNSDAQE
ncbi:hypothetical protein FE784_09865 [Paenibacillus hemerocallicola]|uniref:YiaAB two helix domain-containing protein n=1 Tax=Paenibacillus hemerocallicola TaxID=1172614 RepID=A0A5C4TDH9_9BACL|nr:YiaA/YiaB family inner membrane protein [Paenibacillus hemerocallicola]TNJ66590.1 hypothetical protein FE784_09865 [Paenibacillus hemerocallicola]